MLFKDTETSIEQYIANDKSRITEEKLDDRFQSAETRIIKAQVFAIVNCTTKFKII